MTERDKAVVDLRKDAIDEVAAEMPHATASEVVDAIHTRLDRGLPRLVSVEVRSRRRRR